MSLKNKDYDEEQGEVPGEQDTGPDEYDEDDDENACSDDEKENADDSEDSDEIEELKSSLLNLQQENDRLKNKLNALVNSADEKDNKLEIYEDLKTSYENDLKSQIKQIDGSFKNSDKLGYKELKIYLKGLKKASSGSFKNHSYDHGSPDQKEVDKNEKYRRLM